jgi:hypothetical protein
MILVQIHSEKDPILGQVRSDSPSIAFYW